MVKRVCRIKWPPGDTLGLSIYPSVNFLDLPREVRDRIYHGALLADRPITVWAGSRSVSCHEIRGKKITTRIDSVEARDFVLGSLALSLFRCNPIVAREALETFYRCNIFHFTGFEIWNPMYQWLNNIGSHNTLQLRHITANIPRPERLQRDRCGARSIFEDGYMFTRVHSVDDFSTGQTTQYVAPAIEACFRALGVDGTKMRLQLLCHWPILGIDLWEDEEPDMYSFDWGNMDIANEIERVRGLQARRIDVVWQCVGPKTEQNRHREMMQRRGWKVVDEKESLFPWEPSPHLDVPIPNEFRTPGIKYTLSR